MLIFKYSILIAVLGVFSLPIQAGKQDIITMAKTCISSAPAKETKRERIQRHQKETQCLKELYIKVGVSSGEKAVKMEVFKRLNTLESAFYASRDLCQIQNKVGSKKSSCGTISLSPNEFRQLLKTMIVNEDAGFVRADPQLRKALQLKN